MVNALPYAYLSFPFTDLSWHPQPINENLSVKSIVVLVNRSVTKASSMQCCSWIRCRKATFSVITVVSRQVSVKWMQGAKSPAVISHDLWPYQVINLKAELAPQLRSVGPVCAHYIRQLPWNGAPAGFPVLHLGFVRQAVITSPSRELSLTQILVKVITTVTQMGMRHNSSLNGALRSHESWVGQMLVAFFCFLNYSTNFVTDILIGHALK